jgi:hypothetical protein
MLTHRRNADRRDRRTTVSRHWVGQILNFPTRPTMVTADTHTFPLTPDPTGIDPVVSAVTVPLILYSVSPDAQASGDTTESLVVAVVVLPFAHVKTTGCAPVVGKVPEPPVFAVSEHPDIIPVPPKLPDALVHFTGNDLAGEAADAVLAKANVPTEIGMIIAGTSSALVIRIRNMITPCR